MNELISINYENDRPMVNGRDLHAALQIDTPYAKWFKRMCEYGFAENIDYRTVDKNVLRADGAEMPQKQFDHHLSINMAKHLCMIQRNEIGKNFRDYFIRIEEAWNSPAKIMERALQIAHQRAVEDRKRIMQLEEDKENLQISLNQSLHYYTVAKYNKEFHKKWSLQQCKQIGKALTVFCQNRAIRINKCETNDERFGTVNSYPLAVWKDYLGENS